MPDQLPSESIDSIVGASNADPFAVLGPHRVTLDGEPGWAVRAFLPWAARLQVVQQNGAAHEMERLHPAGVFEARIPGEESFGYVLRATDPVGHEVDLRDPYSFGPLLSELDLYLIGEGTHHRTYEKLGAHIREVGDARGVHFAVWAPNAARVSVVGNFNNWDGRVNPMRLHPSQGIWELFMPGLG